MAERAGRFVPVFVIALLAWLAPAAGYAFCNFTDGQKNPLNPVDLGTWDGVSSITVQSPEVCVVSSFDPSQNSPAIFYDVSAVTIPPVGADQSFLLYSSTDPTQSLPIRLRWLNPKRSGSQNADLVNPGQFYGVFEGRNRGQCQKQTFDTNGQLEVSVDGTVLQSLGLPPGVYTADIEVTARSSDGDLCDPTTVTPTITIPGEVIVTNLDDLYIDATTWLGGPLSVVEDFCIGSNVASGTFSVTVSSGNAGGAGEFQVADVFGTAGSEVYTATLFTGPGATGTAGALTSGATLAAFTPDVLQDLTCTTDNVSLEVLFNEAELGAMQATGAETWGDTITVEVSPN